MGIKGLLQALRPIEKDVHIAQYSGQTVAIDGHCILHRGCFGAASKIALGTPTDSYVEHFMHYIGLFEFHNVTPIVVFDGLPLPLKRETNSERRLNRQTALKEGLKLHKAGHHSAAEKLFQQAISINEDMIKEVIRKLVSKKIQCIVAPTEADAQLTHLIASGKVHAVITEDSDLIAYGCTRVVYKIDRFGNGKELTLKDVLEHPNSPMYNLTPETLRKICILSGCDYLSSIRGVGIKTALKHYKIGSDNRQALQSLARKYKRWIPQDYWLKFSQAELGFRYQWVYDMDQRDYVRLNPLPQYCRPEDIALLGKRPTVQDSTIFRVNRIIPRANSNETHIDLPSIEFQNDSERKLQEELPVSASQWPLSSTYEKQKPSKQRSTADLFEFARRIHCVIKPSPISNIAEIIKDVLSTEDRDAENKDPNNQLLNGQKRKLSISAELPYLGGSLSKIPLNKKSSSYSMNGTLWDSSNVKVIRSLDEEIPL